jgi:hypothetical protein
MAEDTGKKVEDIFERLKKAQADQERASYKLSRTMDDLSEMALKDLTNKLKIAAKQTGYLTDEQLKLLSNSKDVTKNAKDLAEALDHQEKIIKPLNDLLSDYSDAVKKINEQTDITSHRKILEIEISKSAYLAGLHNLKLTEDQAVEILKNKKAFEESSQAAQESAGKLNDWSKHLDNAITAGKSWVKTNVSMAEAGKLLKSALYQSIDELNKATAVGLQDSFLSIGLEAVKLKMSFDQFSDIISKNRDIIRQLGGGTAGVKEFSEQLKKASEPLSFMGKAGTDATALFTGTLKTMGVAMGRDGEMFGKTMTRTQKAFIRWGAVYGDTAEQVDDLLQSQMKGTRVQNLMVGMNLTQRDQLAQEIMLRTDNLKMMGLSNDEIKDFNARLEHAYDPNTLDPAKVIKDAAMSSTFLSMVGNKHPEDKQLQEAVDVLKKISSDFGKTGDKDKALADLAAHQKEVEIFGAARKKELSEGGLVGNIGVNKILGSGGEFGGILNELSQKAATNVAERKTISKAQADKIESETNKPNILVKKVMDARDIKQSADAALESTAGKAFLGVSAAAGALILNFTKLGKVLDNIGDGGILGSAASTAEGVATGGLVSNAISKVGKNVGGLGKFGKFGGAALAGGTALYQGYNAHEDYTQGKITEKEKDKKYGEAIGGFGGALTGGAAGAGYGAMIGSIVPVVGTAIGAALGGIIGGGLGYFGGSEVGGMAGNKFGDNSKINTNPIQFGDKTDTTSQPKDSSIASTVTLDNLHDKNILDENKKQTDLLEKLVNNTSSRQQIDKRTLYKKPMTTVSSNL